MTILNAVIVGIVATARDGKTNRKRTRKQNYKRKKPPHETSPSGQSSRSKGPTTRKILRASQNNKGQAERAARNASKLMHKEANAGRSPPRFVSTLGEAGRGSPGTLFPIPYSLFPIPYSLPYGMYSSNHPSARSSTSFRCSGLTNPCPSLGYTTSSVVFPKSRSACQNSNDCGAGHSPSRSPTTASVGVFTFLMKLIADIFAYTAGSSYTDAPKNGIIHWSIEFSP